MGLGDGRTSGIPGDGGSPGIWEMGDLWNGGIPKDFCRILGEIPRDLGEIPRDLGDPEGILKGDPEGFGEIPRDFGNAKRSPEGFGESQGGVWEGHSRWDLLLPGGLLVGFPEDIPGSRLLPPPELEYYVQQFQKSGFRWDPGISPPQNPVLILQDSPENPKGISQGR